ncbi:SulP family inorganic anion transporter [Sedimentibacter hydroxybenzoicus DSM 7310]|uniref:SulP family inorganic anion transporter n=1 Tax=Sedimentibacter hydroxybenzoicus DSM 7310 TaxID=1123245 RepID=A0A974BL76_SEDHY|nr:SulP family inorganic anion transporter [Sedimentibacter hydroxybenzoicus]NYB75013.1 SulP family inorganic anion transporter [Sedimentibacter hydroxybenzoicus DSM 7310]
MIKQYFQDLNLEFKNYDLKKFTLDAMAGLTVTAVALPLALAFGVSSGAGAPSGIISAIVAGLIMGVLAGASYQVSGPTGTMIAILATVYATHGTEGILITGFLSGILLLIVSIFRFGKLVSFIPAPVITGFTSGIAIIIALGQIDNFFGTVSYGKTNVEKLLSYAELGFKPNMYAVLIGLLVMAIMIFWPKKWNAKIPSSLAGLIIILAVNRIADLPVMLVGEIPSTIFLESRLSLGSISIGKVLSLISPALSIAVLCMIESLLCGASAGKIKNQPLNADRELIAQGVGNILIPFLGGIPASAVLARTSIALKSGGQTRIVSIVQSLGLLFSMLFLGKFISRIPMSALASVLIITAWRMNEWNEIKFIFGKRFGRAIIEFTITMAATVLFDLTIAILMGVFLGMMMFIIKDNELRIDVSPVDLKRIKGHEFSMDHMNTKIIYLTGPLFFITREKLKSLVAHAEDTENIIISMRAVTTIDESAVSEFKEIVSKILKNNTNVLFCGIQPSVKEMLDRSGLTELVGNDLFFWDAIEALKNLEIIEIAAEK